MTLRGVIQGLVHGSGDAEAALAENGYGDLPAEMFGQALSSYADTAPMVEADALSPILTSIDAGDASDVFALMEEHPPSVDPSVTNDLSGLGLAGVVGADAFDALDAPDHDLADAADEAADDAAEASDAASDDEETSFGHSAADADDPDLPDAELDSEQIDTDDAAHASDAVIGDEPTTSGLDDFDDEPADSVGQFEALEDLFDTAPEATDDDPDDLDF